MSTQFFGFIIISMNIYNIFITLILTGIIVSCIIIGTKKGLKPSLLSLASNVIAALAAFLIARLAAAWLWEPAARALSKRILASLPSDAPGLFDLPEIYIWPVTAARVILSSAAFIVFYPIIFLLLKIPVRLLSRKRSGKDGKASPHGPERPAAAALRVTSGVMTFILVLSPVAALCGQLDSGRIDSRRYAASVPAGTLDKTARYPVVKAASAAGGSLFFDTLTSFDRDGRHITPSDELGYTAEFAFNSYDILSFEENEGETQDSVSKIDGALDSSMLLSPSIGAAVPYMAKQWLEGKTFMGVGINLPDNWMGRLAKRILRIISGWSEEEVRENFHTVLELAELLHGLKLNENISAVDLIKIFADRKYTEELFKGLYNTESLRSVIPDIMYSGVNMVLKELGAPIPQDFSPEMAVSAFSEEYAAKEAAIFSGLASTVSGIYGSAKSLKPSAMNDRQKEQLKDSLQEIQNSSVLDSETKQELLKAFDRIFDKITDK